MLKDLLKLNKTLLAAAELQKSIVSNPDAEIDINTAEQSLDELASKDNVWVKDIRYLMADAGYGETPRELMLPKYLRLYVSKIDDGIYSAIVKKEDPEAGDHGEVQVQLEKMTPESMVQALKAKGYLPLENMTPPPIMPMLNPVPERKTNEYAGLYRVLKQHEGELHIHLHKSLNDALLKEIV